MSLIREMLSKIEEEHQIKLEQLNSIKVQHQSLFNSTKTSPTNPTYDQLSNITSISSPITNNSNTSALSLEDKERLVKQKEQNERLKTQSPLTPQPVKQLETAKPKDLTSTLITSNLSNLSLNSRQNSLQQQNYNPSYSMSFTSPMNSQFNNGFNSFQFQPQNQTNSFQTPVQQPLRPNLSAFDKLMIPDLKKPTNSQSQPMRTINAPLNTLGNNNWTTNTTVNNSMNGTQLGSTQQNCYFGGFVDSTSNSGQAKQLSKSELDDFLS
jgi:hypothetical protein